LLSQIHLVKYKYLHLAYNDGVFILVFIYILGRNKMAVFDISQTKYYAVNRSI